MAGSGPHGAGEPPRPGGRRRCVGGLPLSVELHPDWPLEETGDAENGGMYQRIADTGGQLFVRWGERADPVAFRAALEDLVTRVVELEERPVSVLGRAGNRIDAVCRRDPISGHRQSADGELHPVEDRGGSFRVVGLSFTIESGATVLAGYRLPVEASAGFRDWLEGFLVSWRSPP